MRDQVLSDVLFFECALVELQEGQVLQVLLSAPVRSVVTFLAVGNVVGILPRFDKKLPGSTELMALGLFVFDLHAICNLI